ncbi:hypothetical protein EV200_10680 [Pedobacter psychrotolerans]|uniref:Uncharacterized protein n=1 Tax=Pedobacter psychrotolerans TaxID=1843235 RepID=A0A4R2H9J3_9SPHI|nr:hypothetical protein EV200_10680 [Pedobacter psychrotolerans]
MDYRKAWQSKYVLKDYLKSCSILFDNIEILKERFIAWNVIFRSNNPV